MTTQANSFSWWFWPPYDVQQTFDDFVVVDDGFRIRLMGSRLVMSFEAPGICPPDAARSLAEKYVCSLARQLRTPLSLITDEEFANRTEPPLGHMSHHFASGSTSRVDGARAIREARNELLAATNTDMALLRCYDYMQEAHGASAAVAAAAEYKAIEVIEERFGSQSSAVAALGQVVKKAKTAANHWRHIPKQAPLQPKVTTEPADLTRQVLERYETYLLARQGGAKASTIW